MAIKESDLIPGAVISRYPDKNGWMIVNVIKCSNLNRNSPLSGNIEILYMMTLMSFGMWGHPTKKFIINDIEIVDCKFRHDMNSWYLLF